MYSKPSARVYANSMSAVAPASCMWYPEMLMLLNFGIRLDEYLKISDTILMEGDGGYTYVFRTINSFRMSFCMVPDSSSGVTPCSSAATI